MTVIGAGPSRYPRGLARSRDKAVNRRARKLPAEYHSKLVHLDTTYSGTRQGEVGSCVARLETLGGILELVVEAFGEASADLDRRGAEYVAAGLPGTLFWQALFHSSGIIDTPGIHIFQLTALTSNHLKACFRPALVPVLAQGGPRWHPVSPGFGSGGPPLASH